MKVISKTKEETRRFAQELIKILLKNNGQMATILDLKGDLGAGKTTLVQMIGQELGVKEIIQSPTFVLMKAYKTKNEVFKNLIHIDAYRIENIDEAGILGLPKLFADPANLICIEWAKKIREIMPNWALEVKCTLLENDEHQYEI